MDKAPTAIATTAEPPGPRVLIVDDEPAILFAYRRLFEKEGLAVDICDSLEQALRQIAARSYLAVIADLRLAGSDNTDGLEIIRIIRQEKPETSMILATGYGNIEIERTARAMGVHHYFEKPVRPDVIIDLLKALMRPLLPEPLPEVP